MTIKQAYTKGINEAWQKVAYERSKFQPEIDALLTMGLFGGLAAGAHYGGLHNAGPIHIPGSLLLTGGLNAGLNYLDDRILADE